MNRSLHLSVIGAGTADPELYEVARRVGREVARQGCVLVCGGLGGVMAGACQGAAEAGGTAVAIVPGPDPGQANPWAHVVIATGLGHARNVLVVQSGDAVVALPGSWGTMSEIALARKTGRPVVGVGAWGNLEDVHQVSDPAEAVALAIRLARETRRIL